ncbi:MAG: hypothetical protein HC846_01365 [Blastocatellia bacterium]|nr:hypothetical protein [Blastocatellia bacterium]
MYQLLILFAVVQFSFGQAKKTSKVIPNYPSLQIQADKMISAIVANDFETFTDFMFPKLIEMLGGRDKFIEFTKKELDKTTTAGVSILDYQVKKPIQILRVKKQIFAVLPTDLKMKVSDTKVFMQGSMVAISDDNGKNWTFIRVETKESVRFLIPNVIDKLRIPKQKIS